MAVANAVKRSDARKVRNREALAGFTVEAKSAATTGVRSVLRVAGPALRMVAENAVVLRNAIRWYNTTAFVWGTVGTVDVLMPTAIDARWPIIIVSNMVDRQPVTCNTVTSALYAVECVRGTRPRHRGRPREAASRETKTAINVAPLRPLYGNLDRAWMKPRSSHHTSLVPRIRLTSRTNPLQRSPFCLSDQVL